jgi:hypothetical protein
VAHPGYTAAGSSEYSRDGATRGQSSPPWVEENEREIDTKIDSDLKCQSWYRTTWMVKEKREMNGCWNLVSIREGFYKLLKILFE